MIVEEQEISVTFCTDVVRMLIVQPFLEFEAPRQEPFPLSAACRHRLGIGIDNAFAHAAAGGARFVLFPEFGIPGVEGVRSVAAHLSRQEVAAPTIVIGGVSGLDPDEFRELCGLPEVEVIDDGNAPARVQQTQWVNTSVTLVKDDADTVRMWLQPKLSPSWPEVSCRHQSMFKGSVVRFFTARFSNGLPLSFFSLLCFDWIGMENAAQVPEAVLNLYNARCRAVGTSRDIQWAFILQHNPSPNHATFLASTYRFLTQAGIAPFARRRDAAIVNVSTAGSSLPSRGKAEGYGYSSLVFGPQAPFDSSGCWPSVATQPARLRRSNALGKCKDIVFREMGECIHVVDIRVPNFVVPDATDRTPAVVRGAEFPIEGVSHDPRLPGDAVPAVVKWTNDELDELPDVCSTYLAATPLEPIVRAARDHAVSAYRRLDSKELAARIDRACAGRVLNRKAEEDPAADVDIKWDADERLGLRHVIQTLALLGGGVPLDLVRSQFHARFSGGVEIVAIVGSTHDECIKALRKVRDRTHAPIVFVSRDEENAEHLPRETEAFADPRGGAGVKHMDAHRLLTAARTKVQDDFEQFVAELRNVDDRRIV